MVWVLYIAFVFVFAGVMFALLYFSAYRKTGSAVCFGFCKYPLDELYLYRFSVSKRKMQFRDNTRWRVWVRVCRNGAFVREHWLAPWTNAGVNKLYETVYQDLRNYMADDVRAGQAGGCTAEVDIGEENGNR